ncbi:MAG: SUMF1/EgtB/PvdO family nonheme iron enzyme [Anaerolineales bacterium]|nr:SUMF1/EgtB/PvdO family nonheme iron enzyme [Anaerolineales bacterium]
MPEDKVKIPPDVRTSIDDPERLAAILKLSTRLNQIHMQRAIHEGKSGAGVYLVQLYFARTQDRERGLEGYAYLKVDTADIIKTELGKHESVRRGAMEPFVPEIIEDLHEPPNGRPPQAALFYAPAGKTTKSANSFAQLVKNGEVSNSDVQSIVQTLSSALTGWNPPDTCYKERIPMTAREWFLHLLNCGSDSGMRLSDIQRLDVCPTIDKPLMRFRELGWELPNPRAYALNTDLWRSATLHGPTGNIHGDLHGGNIICRTDSVGSLQLIDFARHQRDKAIFYDLAYLELDTILHVMRGADWDEWRQLLEHLAPPVSHDRPVPATVLLEKEPPKVLADRAWHFVQPVREVAQTYLNACTTPDLKTEFAQQWWLAAAAVGLVFAQRSSFANHPEQMQAYLYAAVCLERALTACQIDLPIQTDPAPCSLNATASTSAPTVKLHPLITDYGRDLAAALQEYGDFYVDMSGEQSPTILNPETPTSRRFDHIPRPHAHRIKVTAGLEMKDNPSEGAASSKPIANVRDALRQAGRIVLLGEPGSGKTTTLNRLALDYAHSLETNPNGLIPVVVPLSNYRGSSIEDFHAYVQQCLATPNLAAIIDRSRLLVLCDALNEMPRQDPRTLTSLQQALPAYPHVMVSCREKDFNNNDLDGAGRLEVVDIKPLTPPQMKAIIDQYLYRDATDGEWHGLAPATAHDLWEHELLGNDLLLAAWTEMADNDAAAAFWRNEDPPEPLLRDKDRYGGNWWRDLDKRDEMRRAMLGDKKGLMLLCRNPYMLSTLVIGLYVETGRIPNNRGALFNDFVDALITREIENAQKRQEPWPPQTDQRLIAALSNLAEAMQLKRNVTSLPKTEAMPFLGDALWPLAVQCSILQDLSDRVRFSHQLLQEYFASRKMGEDMDNAVPATKYWAADRWWERVGAEQTALILAGVRAAGDRQGLVEVVQWIATAQPELALDCVIEVDGEPPTLDLGLLDILAAAARAKQNEPHPHGRAAAYRVLGRIGADQRRGIGVGADGLPEIDWVEIPAGKFTYGSDKAKDPQAYSDETPQRTLHLETFHMSRYPITYAQYQVFVEAADGFSDPRWWQGLAKRETSVGEQAFKVANHPREGVSWYDAMAFCRWWSWRLTVVHRGGSQTAPLPPNGDLPTLAGVDWMNPLTWRVRLPTEFEWEKAARGTDGRVYPWGEDYISGYANINETGGGVGPYYLRQTSAVGMYPHRAPDQSPYGVADLSGNVWEWCLTEYDEPSKDIDITKSSPRVVRGGSWLSDQDDARAAVRYFDDPNYRGSGRGFRVVASAPILGALVSGG